MMSFREFSGDIGAQIAPLREAHTQVGRVGTSLSLGGWRGSARS